MLGHDIGNLIGVEGKDGSIGLGFCLRQAQHDSIIASYCLRIHAGALAYPGAHRKCPRGVDRPAKRGMQHHAPIA